MVEQFFQKKVRGVQSIYSPKLKGLLYKWVDKDKMNGIVSTMDENDFEIPIGRLLHFVRTLKEVISGSEF